VNEWIFEVWKLRSSAGCDAWMPLLTCYAHCLRFQNTMSTIATTIVFVPWILRNHNSILWSPKKQWWLCRNSAFDFPRSCFHLLCTFYWWMTLLLIEPF
jgi:hypothetical protein